MVCTWLVSPQRAALRARSQAGTACAASLVSVNTCRCVTSRGHLKCASAAASATAHTGMRTAAAKRSAECGVDDDVLLRKHQAVSLARSLRGISAVTEVLAADTGEDDSAGAMMLGDYLRVALIEAVAAA